ncbi:MAG: ATP-dependent DNA helicase RecG [Phycisphaerales bacterium JB064]
MTEPQANAKPAIELTSPLIELPGVGPRKAKQLAALGLTNVGKLVAHLPSRHEWHEPTQPIANLSEAAQSSAVGEVTATRLAGRYPRQRLEAKLTDETGSIDLVWFNGGYLRHQVQPGVHLRVQGRVASFNHRLQMANPTFDIIPEAEDGAEPQAPKDAALDRRLVPVYPAGEGLKSRAIADAISAAIAAGALEHIDDHLPEDFRKDRALPFLRDAYRMQHAPQDEEELALSRRRLAYDELLMLQLGVQLRRAELRQEGRAIALRADEALHERILSRLPYTPTPGQLAAMSELAGDIAQNTPANRLIQGDVGSGKTMVAAYAMLMAVATGHQAALMAPTEILAEQHYRSLQQMLHKADVRVVMLTGALSAAERQAILADLIMGHADIVVGTHALLTESVKFKSLALAIIDEQHRFGVQQRAALREKAGETIPHTLVMTATPIPRTIAISVLGDLDVTTIGDMPPGRLPVHTEHIPKASRSWAYERLKHHVAGGGRAFVVAPAIGDKTQQLELVESDESTEEGAEKEPLIGVLDLVKELENGPLNDLRIGLLHGRMASAAREAVMERFRSGEVQVLVATTIVEVGVDIPGATCMVIEQADRFGLAQLHQLRGRVGRGAVPKGLRPECLLIAEPATDIGVERMKAITSTLDGFKLAEADFALRGPGELFGSRQSGALPLRVADLVKDANLLELARRDAQSWVQRSPKLGEPGDEILRKRVLRTVGPWLGLADVG